jgi:serine phosphatase RsbU (regulator of sigma subunit)
MRILVGWEELAEADTIALFLNVGENAAKVTTDVAEFSEAIKKNWWDVVVLSLDFPTAEENSALFDRVRQLQPNAPIVGACRPGENYRLLQYLSRGLESHVTRDPNGEFIFLLTHAIESAYALVSAERTRQLTDRLRQEIESVRRLQKSAIPHYLPAPSGYEVAARYEPSQIEVVGSQPVVLAGGDYYDMFSLGSDQLAFLVSDAAGHGMKACMSIMIMHALIRLIREQRYEGTADFVTDVNRRLCESDIVQDEGGFITLLYCILDTSNHTLQWTSAGHPVPFLQKIATNEVVPIATEAEAGAPLGISPHMTYEVCTTPLPQNSRLLLYTDGLAEAFLGGKDPQQQFGKDGIVLTMRATARLPVQEALDMLFVASSAFTGGSGRHDDTSVFLVERK